MVRPRSGVLLGCLLPLLAHAKISTLEVQEDARRLFAVESFGFLVGGVHKMTVEDLKVDALALKPLLAKIAVRNSSCRGRQSPLARCNRRWRDQTGL